MKTSITTAKQSTFEDLIDTLESVRVRDGWLHNDMIFVECGIGYGLTADCRNVCLGDMAAVELYLKSGIDKGFTAIQREILNIVKEIERKNGQSEQSDNIVKSTVGIRAVSTSGKRARPVKYSQYKPIDTRHAKARKVVSLRKA
ncbi:MAG: hypothetical protein PHU23_04595 [Dehalococcoidales bacterium]|nr:hypothetical protein [Dehalococcoidales bacterium]